MANLEFQPDLIGRNNAGKITFQVNGDSGLLIKDGAGTDRIKMENGAITIYDSASKQPVVILDYGGHLYLGGNGDDGDLIIRDRNNKDKIIIDGDSGDIQLLGADCAEEFDVLEMEVLEPGTVLVIDQEGKLRQSTEAYDKKVAGVISGAGNCSPGIVLDKQHSQSNRMPIALTGKVFCKVDAQYAPIEIGDLLTTSPTPGHAMKATDPLKAFGAIIGKALRPLEAGKGLTPILVALQ